MNASLPSARPDPYRAALAVILLFGMAVRFYLLFSTHATEEDFFITLRYAENIATGHGFVFNPGAHVLGTTTPLYTLVLALMIRLGLDPVLGGKLLGIGADALAGLFTYRLGRAVGRPLAGLAAALCLAFAPTNLIWATKGMEVGIVAAVGVGTWMAWAEKREIAAWIGAALMVLLRIDGVALAVFLPAATLWRYHTEGRGKREEGREEDNQPTTKHAPRTTNHGSRSPIPDPRVLWRGPAVFAALLAPWLIFATVYFGSPVPLSLRAKLVVYGRQNPGRFPHLIEFMTLMLHNPLGLVCASGIVLFLGSLVVSHVRKKKLEGAAGLERLLLAPACWIALHYAGMAFSKVFLFGWYFVPPTPIYYLLGMVGWGPLVARSVALLRQGANRTGDHPFPEAEVSERSAPASASRPVHTVGSLSAVIFVTAVCLACVGTVVPTTARTLREGQAVETDLRIPIGLWLRAHAAPTDTVMLEPIGYIGYYSRLKVIDVIGLVSPEALPCYAPDVPSPDHALWTRFHPDWLLLRAGQAKSLARYEATLPTSERLEASYVQAQAWPDPTATLQRPVGFLLFHHR